MYGIVPGVTHPRHWNIYIFFCAGLVPNPEQMTPPRCGGCWCALDSAVCRHVVGQSDESTDAGTVIFVECAHRPGGGNGVGSTTTPCFSASRLKSTPVGARFIENYGVATSLLCVTRRAELKLQRSTLAIGIVVVVELQTPSRSQFSSPGYSCICSYAYVSALRNRQPHGAYVRRRGASLDVA